MSETPQTDIFLEEVVTLAGRERAMELLNVAIDSMLALIHAISDENEEVSAGEVFMVVGLMERLHRDALTTNALKWRKG